MGIGLDRPKTPEEASQELRLDTGGRFDPDIVTVFLQAVMSESKAVEGAPQKELIEVPEEELVTA